MCFSAELLINEKKEINYVLNYYWSMDHIKSHIAHLAELMVHICHIITFTCKCRHAVQTFRSIVFMNIRRRKLGRQQNTSKEFFNVASY